MQLVPKLLITTLQSILVNGNFKVETYNERVLSDLMTEIGFPVTGVMLNASKEKP